MRFALALALCLAACSDPGSDVVDGGGVDAGEIDPRCPFGATPGVWRARYSGPGPTDCVYACRAEDGGSLRMCVRGSTAACVDPRNDPANCGACGNACSGGLVCSGNVCRAP